MITQSASQKTLSSPPCNIVPAGHGPKISMAFSAHTQEMLQTVQMLLNECALSYRNDRQFWDAFSRQLPIVHWQPCERAPGGYTLYLLCRSLPNYDLAHFFSEMVRRFLVTGKQTTILHTKQLTFRFVDAPNESFFVAEIFALVEDDRSFALVQKQISSLAQEIALGAASSHHARHILVTKALTHEHKSTLIHKTIVDLSSRGFTLFGHDVLFEMHYFLLASNDEFKRIRDVRHMCRIICCHNWFRKQLRNSKQTDRQVLVKPMRTNLHFQFGEKHVLGLVITISSLREYEQFEARHILLACQRLIPNCTIIPKSFFCYQSPQDPVYSYYIEIEKQDATPISKAEVDLLKQNLAREIPHSIEQLSHTIFMPYNEEEIMRNILLLSQEIRYVRDIPQMIISFQGQSDALLRFHVTLLRIIKDPDTPSVEALFKKVSELVDFTSGSRKIIGFVRNKHPKEANTFHLECKKSHFMRLDHSVDLSRAREFIQAAILEAIGDVRDFNGGLMSQQNKLLIGIKALLTPDERKEEIHLENLFHSIHPVLMRSLLPPELIKQLFSRFLTLHNERPTTPHPRFSESFEHNAFCIMLCSEDPTFLDKVYKDAADLAFSEQEMATCRLEVEGHYFLGYAIVRTEQERLIAFRDKLLVAFNTFSARNHSRHTVRISLPRPTSSLDPRIGTDRTSGIVIKMLYDGLMRIGPNGNPVFATAKEVQLSNDQKRYTFHLRDCKWTNAKPVLAVDFEYAWKKVLDPNFRAPFSYLFNPIKNAKAIKAGLMPIDELGVYVRDDHILEVELEHPVPYFLEHCAHWVYSPLCKEVDQLHPGWAYYGDDTFVSNGPFRLARWKQNSEIQVLKNQLYWDATSVKLDQIDISIVEDPNNALRLFEQGDLDWIGEPLSEIPPEAFKTGAFDDKISSHPIAAVHWYSCNVKAIPFSSKKCRKALALALNRSEINDKLFQGRETPATSILPPGLSQHEVPYFYDGDTVYARRLFSEGLAELGLCKQDLPPFMITCSDQEIHYSIAEEVSRQWKEVLGLETKIESFKWDRFMEKCWQHDFQVMPMTWYSWAFDPSYNLEHLYSLSHDMNFAQWHSDAYSALLDNARNCLDKRKRLEYLRQAENVVMDEIPIIPLFYYTFKYMKKEDLDKICLSHLGQIDFKWAHINSTQ